MRPSLIIIIVIRSIFRTQCIRYGLVVSFLHELVMASQCGTRLVSQEGLTGHDERLLDLVSHCFTSMTHALPYHIMISILNRTRKIDF